MAAKLATLLLAFVIVLANTSSLTSKKQNSVIDLEKYFSENDAESQERVVGGAAIGGDEYVPYQISMQYQTRDGRQHHFCGGSIIAPNRILTAAHCVNGQDAAKMSIVAGIRDINDKSGQRAQVKSFEMHENYEELVTSDIAILTIEPALEFDGKRIDKIDVSGTEMIGGDQEVTLTGWGAIWHIGQGPFARFPKRLQRLSYKTITNEQCKRTMEQLTDTEICAMERYGKGACNGDSGGPLVMQNGDSLKQVGIVSYGTAVCASNHPDVYTRVSMFNDWLQKRMV